MRLSRPGFSGWLLRFFLPLLVLVVVFLLVLVLVLVLVLLLVLVLEGERSVQRASVNAAAECDGSVWGLSQRHRATEARRGMCRTVFVRWQRVVLFAARAFQPEPGAVCC